MLSFDHVSKDYIGPGETVHAVSEVCLSVARGEFVTLLGPSGSGKTTLLLLAAGILHPDKGRVEFDGEDISDLSEKSAARYRRNRLGFIFQHFNLMPGSAVENVALPLRLEGLRPRDAIDQAEAMLKKVGLGNRTDHVAGQLSGGERQRVSIARALVHSPSMVLADEPTGNLDSEKGDEVLSMLHDLCREQQVAVLVVTHDERANRFADRCYRMKDGCLVATEPASSSSADALQIHG